MSDLSGIGYLAALGFLGAIFIAFLKDIIALSKNRKKQPSSKPKIGDKEDRS